MLDRIFFQFCFMKNILFVIFICLGYFSFAGDTLEILKTGPKLDSNSTFINVDEISNTQPSNIYIDRLGVLNDRTPMDLAYRNEVQPFIDSYLGPNKALISRMQRLKKLYFPLFEQQLDKYDLPLELKYLAIVESALNPKAKSVSGAVGLWQFMYLTGREYGLDVSSYLDERQDPLKSTRSACEYFRQLYDIFGDWNLVLAAYNGGPGYLQRKINSIGSYNFWDLYPHLRKETRNYVPTFIAVNYAMNYAKEHDITTDFLELQITDIDTLTIKKQVEINTLVEILCVNKETIEYLNPSYKKDLFPAKSTLILPSFSIIDFLNNEQANYSFIASVEAKEILINEERIVYSVLEGDYLGRIAKEFGVKVFELKKWNNLLKTNLHIGQKLVVFKKKSIPNDDSAFAIKNNEYIVKQGDTLWDIAQKHNGLSVWKIKSLNNLKSDNIRPGTKIILPRT